MPGFDLGAPFDYGRGGPGGWWIVDEPELDLGRNILVPDLVEWSRDRLAALPREAFLTLAPRWVCKVPSPATARIDRPKALAICAHAGVAHARIVDPALEMLEVFGSEGEARLPVLTGGGDGGVRPEPSDAIELSLSGLWIRPA